MPDYHLQLGAAVDALHIFSPTGFSWFGKRSPRLLPRIEREITARTARSFLHYTLQSRLYSHFYCPGTAVPARDDEPASRPGGLASFVERLSEANCGHGYWADGWEQEELEGLGPGMVAAGRAGLILLAGEGEYKRDEGGGVGAKSLLLRFGKDLPAVSPGFYMALGDADLEAADGIQEPADDLVRFYWHTTPEGAVTLMSLATPALNKARVPFKLKVLNDPERYDRCDAAVLYIRRGRYSQVAALLEGIYTQLRSDLHEATPAFTRRLAPGLGLAEDPGGGDSFGLHRCGLVAEGLIRAYEGGAHSRDARLRSVTDYFVESGISLDAPYLRPGSANEYSFHYKRSARPSTGDRTSTVDDRGRTVEEDRAVIAKNVPASIASQLVGDAIWYEGMCNWLGTEVQVESKGREAGLRREEWATLGPDLYTGTAGVGLFLAEYAALTGDAEARKTSIGAFRHAFYKSESLKAAARPGLYTGWLGIALAGMRASYLLSDTELAGRALDLARRCASEGHPGHEHDLLAGSAGAVVGCLALLALTGEALLLDYAVRLGDEIISSARTNKRTGALCWPSVNARTAAPLTGFSHGTAGIGYALLELWRATGDARFLEASWGAFRYEEGWMNPLNGNWPDFRETGPSRGGKAGRDALVYMTFWCHGAPGIALSRLRAYALSGDNARLEEARTAIGTTQRAVRADLSMSAGNYSLCHGLSGNSTVLLHAHEATGMADAFGVTPTEALIWEVAAEGLRRYSANGWWPCGTGGRPNAQAPGLMLGLAGIGHFYLRLAHPQVPSVLLIEPEVWSNPGTSGA